MYTLVSYCHNSRSTYHTGREVFEDSQTALPKNHSLGMAPYVLYDIKHVACVRALSK